MEHKEINIPFTNPDSGKSLLWFPENLLEQIGSALTHLKTATMTIRTSPEVMQAKAAEVHTAAAEIRREFEDLSRAVERTSAYWNGNAAEQHRRRAAAMKPKTEDMIACLEQHAANLQQIAGLHTAAETKAKSTSAALPTDAIE